MIILAKKTGYLFKKVVNMFEFRADVDFFVYDVKKQTGRYISRHPDLYSQVIDTFNKSWKHLKFYAFIPFSMISRSISKMIRKVAYAVFIF